jgi:sigma-E factor negative regulatory protein RseA
MKYVESTPPPASPAQLLSALHDGQLDAASAAALVKASLQDDTQGRSLMQQWRSMSAISTAMQTTQPFGVVTAASAQAVESHVIASSKAMPPAANDGIFRWKMVAGIAALAAVGSIIWGVAGAPSVNANGPVLAQQTPGLNAPASNVISVSSNALQPAASGQEPMVMIRDPRLDELLAAHKQFGGHSALQQPAGSLRSVSVVSNRP